MIQQYKTLFTAALLAVTGIAANAQKLPNVQQGSLRAPVNIKIDGKASEWKNEFKAYNHATDIFYTISNDDDYLYLTAKATDPEVIHRIMTGGIALTIQKSGKKDDKSGVCVTYPVFDSKLKLFFNTGGKKTEADMPNAADSIMKVNNQKFMQNAKWIGVTGIEGLDSLISVYNEDGIKASGLFDNKKAFTCEIAVALNQLGVSVANHPKMAYHVLLNGFSLFGQKVPAAAGPRVVNSPANYDPISEAKLQMEQTLTAPTDFWGEYILTKK